ncbi:dimethylarginine dimethylaminohydrolase family protein [Candidatus Tisiphia endosymbiont of Temnostethus pusillus]|uniref:dimethylarginine dimethylaminohydrolase family protein n=1 Tax=Candidatus Tisiphia endosymbiont of Temnostethus pusillus TaxID=3139335 RepID=UPI0035C8E8A0
MSTPKNFDVNYTINPWMSVQNKPNTNLAREQWNNLLQILKSWDVKVEVINGVVYPDFVFVADAGIIYNNSFILSNFKFPERKREIKYWKEYFEKEYEIVDVSEYGNFEGSGDSFIVKNSFVCGYGFRTSKKAAYKISEILDLKPIILELIDNNFFHLDTCFSVLNEDTILFYPNAFSKKSKEKIENNFNCLAIPQSEALKFGCNIVSYKNKLILQQGCNKITSIVEKLGFKAYFINLSEFIKAGGGAKCLTLKSN